MRIKINNIYSFDVENKLKQKANGAIYNVQVIGKRRRLFAKTLYKARCTATGRMVQCTKDYLTPYPTNLSEAGERIYTRFPDDMPPITSEDVNTMKGILDSIPKNTDLYTYAFKLKQKIDFYHNARDV